jgi:hypothetical protein
MTRIRSIALLALSLLISGCGVLEHFFIAEREAQPTQSGSEPPVLYMLRGDIAFPMDMSSYCWASSQEEGICIDVFPSSYTSDMHTLVIGNTLELLFAESFRIPYPLRCIPAAAG